HIITVARRADQLLAAVRQGLVQVLLEHLAQRIVAVVRDVVVGVDGFADPASRVEGSGGGLVLGVRHAGLAAGGIIRVGRLTGSARGVVVGHLGQAAGGIVGVAAGADQGVVAVVGLLGQHLAFRIVGVLGVVAFGIHRLRDVAVLVVGRRAGV